MIVRRGRDGCIPSDKVFSLGANLLVWWEVQVPAPVDNLAIRVRWLLCAEWRPADETLKHDGAHGPPITSVIVAFARKDFGRNVVGCADSAVCELTARFSPGVDLVAIANSKLDLIDADGIAVLCHGLGPHIGHQLLVVGRGMFFVEACGESKVRKLNVSSSVKENIVWLDITSIDVSIDRSIGESRGCTGG